MVCNQNSRPHHYHPVPPALTVISTIQRSACLFVSQVLLDPLGVAEPACASSPPGPLVVEVAKCAVGLFVVVIAGLVTVCQARGQCRPRRTTTPSKEPSPGLGAGDLVRARFPWVALCEEMLPPPPPRIPTVTQALPAMRSCKCVVTHAHTHTSHTHTHTHSRLALFRRPFLIHMSQWSDVNSYCCIPGSAWEA
jgi:hypothetical protein